MNADALASDFCMNRMKSINYNDGTDQWKSCVAGLSDTFSALALARWGEDVGQARANLPRFQHYKAMKRHLRNDVAPPNAMGCFELDMSLSCLMARYGTDKGFEHGFFRFYSRAFRELRETPNLKFLEIGVYKGQSFRVWEEWFPKGTKLYGIGFGEVSVSWESFSSYYCCQYS